jgi:surfeit locus 1 family protein
LKPTVRGAAAVLFVLLAAAVCVRLGFWQLDRLEQRRAYNAALQAAMAQPPLVLDEATFAAVARDPDGYLYRRVRVAGIYRPELGLVLRGRSLEGRPGVNAVSGLALAGGGTVLVDRGWVPSTDGATVEPSVVRAAGPAAVDGILQPLARTADAGTPAPVAVGGDTLRTYRRLDAAEAGRLAGDAVLPLYVRALPGGDAAAGPPHPPALAELGEGSHLGYAVQWFSFAAIAITGLLVLLLRPSGRGETRA